MAELPFGEGKPFATEGLAKAVFGGWQLNGIFSSYSGTPFTVTASGTSLNAPGNLQTADQVVDKVKILGGTGPDSRISTRWRFAPLPTCAMALQDSTACGAPGS